jgi:hypothetical protein
MRRIIFGGLVAVTLGLPAAALAKPTVGGNIHGTMTNFNGGTQQMSDRRIFRTYPQNGPSRFSLGGGMDAGNEPGHVTGPGNSPIDNSVRAPINDVQPGHGTTDTRQNAKPKPVY